jgi:addiction module HigA family antidote
MSNIMNYKDIMAFHPGYYVAEIIEDMGVTQAEFAIRMGTTSKTLSQLVNGQANISNDLAQKLSTMLGTSVEFWLNLQTAFDEKVIEINKVKVIDEQIQIVAVIDYSYFVRLANLPAVKTDREKIDNLCSFFRIADLRILQQDDFLVNFRTGITTFADKNVINSRAWLQTALNIAAQIKTAPFNAEKLKSYIPEIRSMTLQNPDVFLPRLRAIFSECGVAFVLLPYLKNSGINGAVKWINQDRVVLAMNDRRLSADTFWFSLFHEIKHVLQQKTKTVFVSSNKQEMKAIDNRLEEEADSFAQNTLIPVSDYRLFYPSKYTSDAEIVAFANKIGIHPGVVAGRLQHDRIIAQNRCSALKQQYKIIM